MGLVGQLEKEIEIKASAKNFYNILRGQCHHIPNLSPDKVHAIDLHEGDWETAGSVKTWKYNFHGNVETFKEKVEVDEENKSVTFIAVGGYILDRFKSYKGTFKLITGPNSDHQTGLVKINLDYEKRNENDPDEPINKCMDFLATLVEDIDAQLLKA